MELIIFALFVASVPSFLGAIFVRFIGYSLGKAMLRRSISWEESAQNNLVLVAVGLAILSFILLLMIAPGSAGVVVLVSIAHAMEGRAVDKEYK